MGRGKARALTALSLAGDTSEHVTAARGAAEAVPGWEKGNQALEPGARISWAGGKGLLINTALMGCTGPG